MLLLSGNELGWVCLGSCVSDIVINSFAIFWVSSSSYSPGVITDRFSIPTMEINALTFAKSETGAGVEAQNSNTFVSSQDTVLLMSSTIPESYFDYIPPGHRGSSLESDSGKPVSSPLEGPTDTESPAEGTSAVSSPETTSVPTVSSISTYPILPLPATAQMRTISTRTHRRDSN